ncbi:MAG: SET domain-containing protein-lysine N-methyltransferase [Desmonostoc geniculatum HA4340-LM1]|jgi:hypothetical protein|nr:SET domain-containing protein-lysine N-methyltransferase [Desmonostoc geniculatum HA4340-LM1]
MAKDSVNQDVTVSLIEKVTLFAEVGKCAISESKSIHARINFREGQIFSQFGAKEILDQPNYLTVQINQFQHIMLDPEWLQYINHSCDPNVFFDTKAQEVRVIKPIEIGEEVTFFYPSTEWSMSQAFKCLCKSENCINKIQGASFLSPEILSKYKLSDYIKGKIEADNLYDK